MKAKKLQAFSVLLLEASKPISIQDAANTLHVSSKTVYNYLKELEYVLEDYGLYIEHGKAGLFLKGDAKQKQAFRRYYLSDEAFGASSEKRRKEIYERLLMKEATVSLNQLEEEYQVAKSSLVLDLEAIEALLKPYNLSLKRSHKGTKLEGKEQDIRMAMQLFIEESYQAKIKQTNNKDPYLISYLLQDYMSEEEVLMAQAMIHFIAQRLPLDMDDFYYNQLFVSFAIFLKRIHKGHFLVSTTKRPNIMSTYGVTLELCEWLTDSYGLTIEDIEIPWLNARIAGAFHARQDNTIFHNAEIEHTLNEMIQTMSLCYGEDLSRDVNLHQGLQEHMAPMFSRTANKVKVIHPYKDALKKMYPAAFAGLSLACLPFEMNFYMRITEDEIAYLLSHFEASQARLALRKKALIVVNAKGADVVLAIQKIKRCLPPLDAIVVKDVSEIHESMLKEYAYVLSTCTLNYEHPCLLTVSILVDENDEVRIHALLHRQHLDIEQIVSVFKGHLLFASQMDATFQYDHTLLFDRLLLVYGFQEHNEVKLTILKKESTYQDHKIEMILSVGLAYDEESANCIASIYQFISYMNDAKGNLKEKLYALEGLF